MSIKRYWKWRYIIPAAIVGGPVIVALFVVVTGGLVMLLWNWLLPALFELPRITIWQGFGLLALCRILFGGFGGGHGSRSKHMTHAEREQFRARMRERFHQASSNSEPPPTPTES